MKTVLINRSFISSKGLKVPPRKWQPLNLAYIAAILENEGVECQIIDAKADELTVDQVIQQVKSPDLIIFATEPIDLYQCPNPNWDTITQTIKGIEGQAPIIAFGPQITLFTDYLMSQLSIDYVIKGDDPLGVAQKALDVLKIKSKPIELPVPAYHLLPMDKYSSNMQNFPEGKFAIAISAKGCPYNCKFCFKDMIGSQVNFRRSEMIMKEIDTLVNQYNVKTVYFLDELFTFKRQRIIDLCQRIKKYNILWGCQSRIDRVDEELLMTMYQAGCRYVSYGIESGSPRIIKHSQKNIDLEQAGQVIEMTDKVGIFPHINMMYGFPTETEEDMKQTIDFMIKHSRDDFPITKIDYLVNSQYYNEYLKGKSQAEATEVSQRLGLSEIEPWQAERQLARWMLHYKKLRPKALYFLFKYLFPKIVLKFKK